MEAILLYQADGLWRVRTVSHNASERPSFWSHKMGALTMYSTEHYRSAELWGLTV